MLDVVRLPPAEAAQAVWRAWEANRAVAVLDPRQPEAEAERARAVLAPGQPVAPEVAAVVLTSGTAGRPRAVELTWDGMVAAARAVSEALGADAASDRWWCALPLHHVAGLAVVARAWVTGVPVTFDPGDTATLTALVPTQVRRLDVGRFRRVLVGGGPVPADIAALPNVVRTYGMTETWGGVVHDGRPFPGVEVRLAPGSDEILVRTPTVMRGYRGDPEGTAAVMAPGGWLRTGDAGRIGDDGRLEVVDRLKDLIVTGGVKVSPTEVEAVLAAHPSVADAAVAGVPDPEWGERVTAWVVAADPDRPPTLDDLRAFARARLSAAKLPRQVVLVPVLPRSPGGKVRRRLLPAPP